MVLQEYFQARPRNRDPDHAEDPPRRSGVCGVYTKDVAATKVELVLAAARRGGHPLQCIMEAA